MIGRRRLASVMALAVTMSLLAVFVITRVGSREAVDAYIYWSARFPELYTTGSIIGDQNFHYSPAFAQLISPLVLLPFEAFHALWMAMLVATLAWLVGPVLALVLILIPWTNVLADLVIGNIHVLLGAAIVVGFRFPAAWALPLLTKVTPGIGLLWFAMRREWGKLIWGVLTTAAICVVSLVAAPTAWAEWVNWILHSPDPPTNPDQLLSWAPLWARLAGSIALIAVAAPRNIRWILPLAVWLALPVIWYNSLVLLAAAIPLAWASIERYAPLRFLRPWAVTDTQSGTSTTGGADGLASRPLTG